MLGAPLKEWIARGAAALLIVAAVAIGWRLPLAWPLRAALLAIAVAVGIDQAFRRIPAFDPLRRVRGRLPHQRGTRRCAITFDDGPSGFTDAVLDVLSTEGVPATFFVLGAHVDRFPDCIRRAHAEGHAIGIHGFDHRKLAGADEAAVERQIAGATDALRRAGVERAPVYRTPHGFKSRAVLVVARRHGLALWAWSRGIWDTDRPPADVLVRRATRLAGSRMVLLLHDGRGDERNPDASAMVSALPSILRTLKARGFTFVRLADV